MIFNNQITEMVYVSKLSEKTKWLLVVGAVLIIGSIVYGLTLWILNKTEIQWQYPVIIAVIIVLVLMLVYYFKYNKLESALMVHCTDPAHVDDKICNEFKMKEIAFKVNFKP
jgi:putative effector of murein hydrolase